MGSSSSCFLKNVTDLDLEYKDSMLTNYLILHHGEVVDFIGKEITIKRGKHRYTKLVESNVVWSVISFEGGVLQERIHFIKTRISQIC